MKKNTHTRIVEYGALTTLLGLAIEANGQIIYTDVNPDEGGAGVLYSLDMDNDANADFIIQHHNSATFMGSSNYNVLTVSPASSISSAYNSVLVHSSQSYVTPFALNEGDVISAGDAVWIFYSSQVLNNSCIIGDWCGVTDKYLGLSFKIGEETHYGWARLDVGTGEGNWVIKDYAYNSVADEPIEAGEGILKVPTSMAENVEIIGLNKTIALYHLPGNTAYRIIDMTGNSVLEGTVTTDAYVIQNESLRTGIYIVELIDENTGETIRKKVIL